MEYFKNYGHFWSIPVAARSKVWICGHLLSGNAGLNSTSGMDVCRLWVLCVVVRSLFQADHLFIGALLSMMRLEFDHEALILGRSWCTKGSCTIERKKEVICVYKPLISQSWLIKILWDVQMFISYLLQNRTEQYWTYMYLGNYEHLQHFNFLNILTFYVPFKMMDECKT